MLYTRVLLLAASLVVAAVSGYYFFSYDSERAFSRAQDLFLRGENKEADAVLDKLGNRIPFTELQLYKAYIARAEGEIDKSDRYLEEALNGPLAIAQWNVPMELYLNQMLNAYLKRDADGLLYTLEKVRRLTNEKKGWVALFSSLEAYLNKDYDQAIREAQQATDRSYLSPWMWKVFRGYFPPSWLPMFTARCEIGLGDLAKIRQELETASLGSSSEEQIQTHFLIGLSYVKEAEAKAYNVAIPYYKLAFSYFNRIPIKENRFQQEREEILIKIRENIYAALEEKSYEDLEFYAEIVDRWKDHEEMQRFETRLLQTFENSMALNQWEQLEGLAVVLSQILDEGETRETLTNRFETLVTEALEEGCFENLPTYWAVARLFSRDLDRLVNRSADHALKKLFLIIKDDDANLTRTAPYMNFWGQIERDPNNRYQFAQKLVALAENMWHRTREREKAIKVMSIARSFPAQAQKRHLRESLEKKFQEIFLMTLHHDDVADLNDIYDAVTELELANVDLNNNQDKAKLIKEAQQLYQDRRYEEAKKKAQWVYRLDPQNQEAGILLGMIAYLELEYQQAYGYLQDIKSSDLDVMEVQAVTYILADKIKEGNRLLKKVSQTRPIKDETYLRLGFGLLVLDKPIAALQWFEEVETDQDVVLAGRCFAAFGMYSWSEVVNLYRKLPAPYDALDGFQGIAVESLTALGEASEAEEVLSALLRKPPQPSDDRFPMYFQAFKRKKLDYWNRNFVAAQFFRVVKGEPEKALEYFNKIEDPMSFAEIDQAELLMDFGRNYEGKRLLLKVLEQVQGSEQEKQVKIRLLPLLGAIHAKLGFFAEAWPYYKEFFFLKPEDNTYRADFAKVLIQLQRFDLAFDHYRQLSRSFDLKPVDMIAYIECMIHTDRFELADKTAWKWLTGNKVPLAYQIRLARLMVITKNWDLVENVISTLSKREKRTIEEDQQLIRFWTEMANYDDALALARFREKELEETTEGLKVLVDLYVQQSQFDNAMFFAERAFELAPTDFGIADFLERYEREPEIIARSVKLLKKKMEDEPDSTTLKLNLAADLVDLAIASYSSGEITDIRQSNHLHQARGILNKIIEKNKELPEAYYLLGKVYYLLGKDTKAKEAYQNALRLDVSYVKAYQHLALVYEGGKDYSKAIELIQKASTFDPNNSEIWEQLGALYSDLGKAREALEALKRANRFMPNEPGPFIRMAEVYLQLKDPEKAISNLEQALDLSPKDMEAIKLMLVALHDPKYRKEEGDSEDLKRRQLRYFDKLQALDPKEADAMREYLGVEAE